MPNLSELNKGHRNIINKKECKRLNDWVSANSYCINANYTNLKNYTDMNVSHLQTQLNSRNQFAKLSEYNGTVILLNDGTDLNTVTGTGFYNFQASTCPNSPKFNNDIDGWCWYYLEVMQHSNFGFVYQRATTLNKTDGIVIFHREFLNNNYWSSWSRL